MDESVAARLLAFIEKTSDLVGVTDDAGRVVWVNDATRKRLGLGAGEPISLTTADLFPESAFNRYFEEVRPAILRSGVWSGLIPVQTADGGSIKAWMTVVGGALPGGDIEWLVTSGRDVTKWINRSEELSWRATHDELTGLDRRVVLADRLDRALARARRTGQLVGVVFIDVDHLKTVNDTFGHQAGDEVLAEIAHRVKGATRDVDTVVRVGGDEFVVVIDGVANRGDAMTFTDRLHAAVTKPVVCTSVAEISVSASIGMVLGGGDSQSDNLLRDADAAMYDAKRNRRGSSAAVGLDAEASPASLTAHGVSVALTQQLIAPYYQPVVDLRSGATVGLQALARLGSRRSAHFVELVQDSGVAVALDLAVLRRATVDAGTWVGASPLRVYVHLSSAFLADTRAESSLHEVLERAPLHPEQLALEIPQALLVGAPISLFDTLRSVGDLGVRLVISQVEEEDPGAMGRAAGLFSELRLGRHLTADMELDPSRAQVASALISRARQSEMAVFAVGVETADQRQRLIDLGCRLAIGRLFGWPSPRYSPGADIVGEG